MSPHKVQIILPEKRIDVPIDTEPLWQGFPHAPQGHEMQHRFQPRPDKGPIGVIPLVLQVALKEEDAPRDLTPVKAG